MNVETVAQKKITVDAAKMTALSIFMQTAAMLFNVILSRRAGTAAVGLMSLTFTLFGFIMVLANGNIYTSTGRFISEARGAGHENFSKIMRYSLTFSLILSCTMSIAAFSLSDNICTRFFGSNELSPAVRLISLSLPFAAAGSCIKGYFTGIRAVNIPMRGDLIEFAAKWTVLFSGLLLFGGTELFYISAAAGILSGELISFIYYLLQYKAAYKSFRLIPICSAPLLTDTPAGYLKNTAPIVISGYVRMLLSMANELLVPAALLKFSHDTNEALSGYGLFEAMIMPAMFFPAALCESLSGVIMPEAALANRVTDPDIRRKRLSVLTDSTFVKTLSYSFFIAAIFLFSGNSIGSLLCPEGGLVGRSLSILAPVIPFIYMEIILEGLLKGMGRQNFSTVTSLWEYAVRIACVMIFVGKIGFGGVIISYYVSNVLSNIARIIAVTREAGLKFDPVRYIILPMLKGIICCIIGRTAVIITHAAHSGELASLILFILTAVTSYALTGMIEKNVKSPCRQCYTDNR